MNYNAIMRAAWQIATRHRFLWLFGIFAGGAVVPTVNFNVKAPPPGEPPALPAWVTSMPIQTVLMIMTAILLAVIVFATLNVVARAGLARCGYELCAGRPCGIREGWDGGLYDFWRVAFVDAAVFTVVFGYIGVAVAPLVLLGVFGGEAGLIVAALGGIAVALSLFPVLFGVSVWHQLAIRETVLRGLEWRPALLQAWRLMNGQRMAVFVAWVLQVAVATVAGMVLGMATILVAVPLWALGALHMWVVVIPALLVSTAALSVVGGILSAFLSVYWTLAWLELYRVAPSPVPTQGYLA